MIYEDKVKHVEVIMVTGIIVTHSLPQQLNCEVVRIYMLCQ